MSKYTYIGSCVTMVVRIVSSALMRLPGSTLRRLTRPLTGARTCVKSRFSLAVARAALVEFSAASPSFKSPLAFSNSSRLVVPFINRTRRRSNSPCKRLTRASYCATLASA